MQNFCLPLLAVTVVTQTLTHADDTIISDIVPVAVARAGAYSVSDVSPFCLAKPIFTQI